MSEIKKRSVPCRSQQGAKFTAVQQKIAGLQVRECDSLTQSSAHSVFFLSYCVRAWQTLLEALSKLSPNDSSNKDFFIRVLTPSAKHF
jgi:hypothetical protein